jgi:hypothetical protein
MEWYICKGVHLHLEYLAQRAVDSGDWKKKTMSEQEFRQLLDKKIDSVGMKMLKADIIRFICDLNRLITGPLHIFMIWRSE